MFDKIGSYTFNEVKEVFPSTEKGATYSLLSKKTKSLSNTTINLHPKGRGKGYEVCKIFGLDIDSKTGKICKAGYISDFNGTKEGALLIHGSPQGRLAMHSSKKTDRKTFTVKKFISVIKEKHAVNLKDNKEKPLHIISCFGASNGVYQSFADKLGKEVIGYGDGGVIVAYPPKYYLSNPDSMPIYEKKDYGTPKEKIQKANIHRYFPSTLK